MAETAIEFIALSFRGQDMGAVWRPSELVEQAGRFKTVWTPRLGTLVAACRSLAHAVAQSRAWKVVERMPAYQTLYANRERIAISGGVAAWHVFLVLLIVWGLTPRQVAEPENVLTLGIGGPFSQMTVPPRLPELRKPDVADVPPPVIDVDVQAPDANVVITTGSPNVTEPAEAIAETHTFPLAPADAKPTAPVTVRLLLSITADGLVSDASVVTSSGSDSLDQLAIAWAKAHWRYRPARREGLTIPVQTTSIVVIG